MKFHKHLNLFSINSVILLSSIFFFGNCFAIEINELDEITMQVVDSESIESIEIQQHISIPPSHLKHEAPSPVSESAMQPRNLPTPSKIANEPTPPPVK